MTMRAMRFGSVLLLSGVLLTTPGSAFTTGYIVTVAFNGTGTYPGNTTPVAFHGTFTYEQTHTVSNIPGKFAFQGSPDNHSISYTITGSSVVSGSGAACDPFTIFTSATAAAPKTTFELTASTPAETTVAILIPMTTPSAPLDQRHLPYSTAFPVPPPAATTTFTVTNAGTVTFSGTIATLIPSEQ
jgi:hypothetical protein